MNPLSIRHTRSWAKFEQQTLEIFTIALEMLSTEPSLPEVEDSEVQDNLNRRLEQYMPSAIRKWEVLNRVEFLLPSTPRYNSRQPAQLADKEIVRSFERKKPDFQWEIRDSRKTGLLDENPDLTFRFYHVECKRLRSRSRSTRFTSEYVVNGICRFIKKTHCYGQHVNSGAMVAYVQDMELQPLLDEVNDEALLAALPQLQLAPEGWQTVVSRLDHQLNRTEVEPTPFNLRHLWVDLRHHYLDSDRRREVGDNGELSEISKPPRKSRRKKTR